MSARVRECGDSMLLVEFEAEINPATNDRVIALATAVRARAPRGVHDIVPGYCAVGVHFDPLQTDLAALERLIDGALARVEAAPAVGERPVVEIPVQYGGESGPDLETVAEFAGCDPDEVVRRHLSRIYRVYMLGFVPGFAYLGRVDRSIAAPRRRVPRERVPAGSVGIAGEQTGVYPSETPGGWQLIGRTTVRMFDPSRPTPSLLAAGDAVRFVRESD